MPNRQIPTLAIIPKNKNMRIFNLLFLFLLITVSCYSQKSGKYVSPIIKGTWMINYRGPMVNSTNLDVYTNLDKEILNSASKEIRFNTDTYWTTNQKSGKYTLKVII